MRNNSIAEEPSRTNISSVKRRFYHSSRWINNHPGFIIAIDRAPKPFRSICFVFFLQTLQHSYKISLQENKQNRENGSVNSSINNMVFLYNPAACSVQQRWRFNFHSQLQGKFPTKKSNYHVYGSHCQGFLYQGRSWRLGTPHF